MESTLKNILVLNAGSSSTKIALYQVPSKVAANQQALPNHQPVWQMEVDFPPGSSSSVDWKSLLASHDMPIHIVGHRIVHGGINYAKATVIDESVKANIKDCIKLAPLHNKTSLDQIEAMEKLLPAETKQIAVFDTAFHKTLPQSISFYPVPYAWHEKYNIRRFGFHGINYQYCTGRAANLLKKKATDLSLIMCHLGAGCSVAAVDAGKSVNTSMGFTPTDGLMMASRSGSLDPGIILYLLRNENMTAEQIDKDLNQNSGLKGISEFSGDMKTIIETMQSGKSEQREKAELAFTMFVEHLSATIASMRTNLKKLDALIFTAGIGEHASFVREKTCAKLDFLGIQLDDQLNKSATMDQNIASSKSKTAVLVIQAREDWEIARQCVEFLD